MALTDPFSPATRPRPCRYAFRVAAINTADQGPFSEPSALVAPDSRLPEREA